MTHRIGARLTLAIAVMSLLSSIVLTASGYRIYRQAVEKKYIDSGHQITETVAGLLDGDTAERYWQNHEYDDFHENFTAILKAIRKSNNIKYLYVAHFQEDGSHFIFDADDNHDFPTTNRVISWEHAFGQSIDQNFKNDLLEGKEVPPIIIEAASYGKTFTIQKPLVGKDGQVKKGFYVCGDFEMERLKAEQNAYFGILFILAVVIAALFAFVQRRIVHKTVVEPLVTIAHTLRNASEQEEPMHTELTTDADTEEFAYLVDAFNTLRVRLQNYIADLAHATAEKERIGAELEVARTIQSSMMPLIFPPFPEHNEFELYAEMIPAKEVGGDFYDFFFVDQEHLALVIADVSGKGIAAAMFMIIVKTLLKKQLLSREPLHECAQKVNIQLCQNNESNMFVTVWMGIYNTKTGEIEYVNAGHNPPLLKKYTSESRYIRETARNLVMGIREGMSYRTGHLKLSPNDLLFLYTDGITESHNDPGYIALYGEANLSALLDKETPDNQSDLAALFSALKADIHTFTGGAEQSDDITMLALKRRL